MWSCKSLKGFPEEQRWTVRLCDRADLREARGWMGRDLLGYSSHTSLLWARMWGAEQFKIEIACRISRAGVLHYWFQGDPCTLDTKVEGEEHFPKRIQSLTRKTSLHVSGKRLRARAFHRRAALNLFKCLNSVQAPEICTRKTEHWLWLAKCCPKKRGSGQYMLVIYHTVCISIAHPDLLPTPYSALQSTCPSLAPLASDWVLPMGSTSQSSEGRRTIKLQCPLGTSLQNHHGLAMQLHLRHPSPAFSVLMFCNCSLPHSFRPTEEDDCLLLLPSGTAPPLKLYLHLAYTFYTFPFIKLSSNYPIYTCHLFIAWTLPGTSI